MRNKLALDEKIIVPIVKDAAIATQSIGGGRMIPLLTLDCSNHKELLNLFQLHSEATLPGDATCTWGISFKLLEPKLAVLIIEFTRPLEIKFALSFELNKYGGVADGIIQSRGLYIQPMQNLQNETLIINEQGNILIEVHPNTMLPKWDNYLLKVIRKKLKKQGFSRKEAITVSFEFLERTREIWKFRAK